MANYDTLKATIAARIHDNTEQEITALDVRQSFNDVLDAVNATKEDEGAIAPAQWGGITGTLADQTDLKDALDAKQAVISDLATIRSGAAAGATAYQKPSAGIPGTDLDAGVRSDLNKARSAVQPGDLAMVASTGDYDDLLDKPSLATVATSGSYDDLTNKPTIPDVTGKADKVSGATSGDFAGLDAYGNLTDSGSKAADFATAAQGAKADTAVQPGDLATVATSGDYDDLLNKPTIPAAQVQADWNEADNTKADYIKNKPTIPPGVVVDQTYDPTSANAQSGVAVAGALAGKQDVIADLATIEAGAAAGATAVQPGDLATVATSGLYSDLTGTPTIPAAPGTLNTDNTGAQAVSSSEALSGTVKLHKVSKTGSYNDLLNKPTIPTVPTTSSDVAADKANNDKVTGAKAVYDFVKPATGSSIPAGGLLPGVKYHLGTLSGSVTMTLATAADASVENEYKGDFTTDSTAPTITWQGVTQWAGNCLDSGTGLPVLTGGKHYEFNIENGYGLIAEFGV